MREAPFTFDFDKGRKGFDPDLGILFREATDGRLFFTPYTTAKGWPLFWCRVPRNLERFARRALGEA